MKLLPLPPELARAQEEIEGFARRAGLSFYRTVFEVVDYDQMNALAAYGGFPTRYPHYRWGMEYNQISKSYEYGLHKIYEMVVNNDPTYAYLLEGNTTLDQKLVMAHVYGHADFFYNNMYYAHTNRKMIDEMANHATHIRRYQDRPVPDELLQQILEAARWAPSATNRQPWRFIVIRDPQLRSQVAQYAAAFVIRWAHV